MKNRKAILKAVSTLYDNGLIDGEQVDTIINDYLMKLQGNKL